MNAVLSEYVPQSWFHPKGAFKVVKRLEKRLPDVSGKLFLTLTLDPSLFSDPQTAFEMGRDRIRRMFYRIRKGVQWEGKEIRVKAPYCVKVEFHKNGWAHFHIIFLTNRFIPGKFLNEQWGLGRTNVDRINNRKFRYLLKYVCKAADIPEWVKEYRVIRIFQTSKGFYVDLKDADKLKEPTEAEMPEFGSKRNRGEIKTIGERMEKWEILALCEQDGKYSLFMLDEPWQAVFAREVYGIAIEGRYLGKGRIQITESSHLIQLLSENTKKEVAYER